MRNAPPYLSFRSCPKRKTAPRPGLRVAAAGGRRRRPGISAAAPFAGCREAGPQRAMRQGGGRKKRALRAIYSSVFDSLYARLPTLGANCFHVGNLFAPVSAEGFAYARAAACAKKRRPCTVYRSRSPGRIQRGAEAPLCVVLIRESQGRGRNRNLPLPCGVSFATFLWPNKEKLNTQLAPADRPVLTGEMSVPSATVFRLRQHLFKKCRLYLEKQYQYSKLPSKTMLAPPVSRTRPSV